MRREARGGSANGKTKRSAHGRRAAAAREAANGKRERAAANRKGERQRGEARTRSETRTPNVRAAWRGRGAARRRNTACGGRLGCDGQRADGMRVRREARQRQGQRKISPNQQDSRAGKLRRQLHQSSADQSCGILLATRGSVQRAHHVRTPEPQSRQR